jgi:hypothetical protein
MVLTYFFSLLIPELPNFIFDIFVRSILMTLVFGSLIVVLKVSGDVDDIKKLVISRIRSLLK